MRDLRRSQILTEARAIITDQGLAGLTFGALEKRLSFTRGVITYHFKNKEEILHAVLDQAILSIHEATVANVEQYELSSDRIRAAIEAVVKGFLTNTEAGMVLISFWSRILVAPHIADKNASLYRRYRRQTASLIDEGKARGEFRADIDTDSAAAIIVGITIGIVTQTYFEASVIDVDQAIADGGSSIVDWMRVNAATTLA